MPNSNGRKMMGFALERRYDNVQEGIARKMNALLRRESRQKVGDEELDLFLLAECVEHCKKLCEWLRENGLVGMVEEHGLSETVVRILDAGVANVALCDVFPELGSELPEPDEDDELEPIHYLP